MFAAEGQDLALDHGALDVIVLQDDILLEAFDGVVAVTSVIGRGRGIGIQAGGTSPSGCSCLLLL